MEQHIVHNEMYDRFSFKENPLKRGVYENCKFSNCDFSDMDLSGIQFVECIFIACNLSLVRLNGTAFRDIIFKDCKMLGLRFEHCNDFGLSFNFERCILDHSSFYGLKIKKTVFRDSRLHGTDFAGCNLTGAVFDCCDLMRTIFENTNLEKVDLRTAYNYSIDPEANQVKKARFVLNGLPGLLDRYDIEIDLIG